MMVRKAWTIWAAGFTIGRNVVLGTDLTPEDFAEFTDKIIPNGKKVNADKRRMMP